MRAKRSGRSLNLLLRVDSDSREFLAGIRSNECYVRAGVPRGKAPRRLWG